MRNGRRRDKGDPSPLAFHPVSDSASVSGQEAGSPEQGWQGRGGP